MGTVRKIIGPPGTGKTTYCSGLVSQYIQAGIAPGDICICSFTRAAAERSRASAAEKTGLDPQEFGNVGTLHSLAYHLLGVNGESKVGQKNLVHFFQDMRLKYDPATADGNGMTFDIFEGRDGTITSEGAWFLGFWDWFRSIRWKPGVGETYCKNDDTVRKMVYAFPGGFRIFGDDRHRAANVAVQCWRAYENLLDHMQLWDFARLIEMTIRAELRPHCRVLIVDEAQDLSPMLWYLALQWAQSATIAWFAGDPYQAIYEFAGAAPSWLRDLPVDPVQLSDSFRLSPEQIDTALHVLRHDPDFERFPWNGKPDLERVAGRSGAYLARTRRLLSFKTAQFRREGIPYASNRVKQLVQGQAARSAYGGLALHETGEMTLGDLSLLLSEVPSNGIWIKKRGPKSRVNEMKSSHGVNATVSVDELEALGILDPLVELLKTGNPWPAMERVDREARRDLSRMVTRNGGRDVLIDEPWLFATTIHAAKGLEWDVVQSEAVWGGMPYRNYMSGASTGEEARVAYVHVTRALQQQHIVATLHDYGPIFPPLRGYA